VSAVKYKRIPSAAHNFGHSFVSILNAAAMCDLALTAAKSGVHRFRVDLLVGAAEPEIFLTPDVTGAIASYVARFPEHLAGEGIDIQRVQNATLTIDFMLAGTGAASGRRPPWTAPFRCLVTIGDDRGEVHHGRIDDAWHVHDSVSWLDPPRLAD